MTRVDPNTPYTKSYRDALHSPEWKALKREKIDEFESTCELCGTWCDKLELHHKHYRSIGRERCCDVQILCRSCHRVEDNVRIRKKRNQKLKGVVTFGNKKYGRGWEDLVPFKDVADEFDRWLKKKGRKKRGR